MEKRIELEKRARKSNQITELNLDNCRSTSIVGLSDEYTALETLSLINVGLTTLKGFPKLPNLKKLELSDNRISSGLNYLSTSPRLQYLNLSGNKIKDLETLKPLEEFKNLVVLDLFNNEATQIENYREKIFNMLPSLKYLDGLDCNEVDAPSEDDYGNDSYDEVSDSIVTEEDDDSDDNDDDLDEEGDFDEGDVSLSEVYNDDLEEDNSEWDEEDAGAADDDDDYEDYDDEEEGGAAAAGPGVDGKDAATSTKGKSTANKDAENASAEESQARGKKRKHDG